MIHWKKQAKKDLNRIPQHIAQRIILAVEKLHDTGKGDVRKLEGPYKGLFRLRVGDYRVIFCFEGKDITVMRIGHRRDVYRL